MAKDTNKTVKVRLVRGLRGTSRVTACRCVRWA